ncbi:MAG: MFS transporter [Pseudomonadota bacterium]
MTLAAKLAMMFVVLIDIIGQGLVFPILNTLMMDPATAFLPEGTSNAVRHFNYGVVMAAFFIAWFFGSPYMSQLSDLIGRKSAILVCLCGALFGYALTIAALYLESVPLLVLGRAITGLTAGNQPIAQAALIDGSVDEADRGRNMGYVITATSGGLLLGPLIGGVFSDPRILGSFASLQLPFFVALGLVGACIVCVTVFFKDLREERQPVRIRPLEVFDTLLRIRNHPTVLRLAAVMLLFHITNTLFYIFIGNYLQSEFGIRTFGTSLVMLTIGVALALSSTFLVAPAQKRFNKKTILYANFAVWFIATILVSVLPTAPLNFIPVFAFYFIFGISYPTFLSLFSLSVSDEEQGWVMGMTLAVFTLCGGVVSLFGSWLIATNLELPFYVAAAASALGAVAMAVLWRTAKIDAISMPPKD